MTTSAGMCAEAMMFSYLLDAICPRATVRIQAAVTESMSVSMATVCRWLSAVICHQTAPTKATSEIVRALPLRWSVPLGVLLHRTLSHSCPRDVRRRRSVPRALSRNAPSMSTVTQANVVRAESASCVSVLLRTIRSAGLMASGMAAPVKRAARGSRWTQMVSVSLSRSAQRTLCPISSAPRSVMAVPQILLMAVSPFVTARAARMMSSAAPAVSASRATLSVTESSTAGMRAMRSTAHLSVLRTRRSALMYVVGSTQTYRTAARSPTTAIALIQSA